MPGPKAIEIDLSPEEKTGLEKLIKGHTSAQQLVLRAKIVLAAGAGKSNSQIVRELGVPMNTVRLWRSRWQLLAPLPLKELSVSDRLADLPRSGAPARITAAQRCRIEGLACEKPEQSKRPITHWTNHEVAAEIMKRGIVAQISARHAGRLLKRGGYQAPSDPLLADPGTR